ncbi:HAMP domain-containing protein [Deinococcus multiflagellatus]|uniref:HAMP domain-containing protein n=1 Tax=Deinococcus multiflagellatus TaxID=1656887 RepID=UPI001CCD783C|nr:HAMP domain-containing protein [Deinococcus multiflagellatus]MBZ9713182.1 hypothetical protein [Deinococcus multiflagellatus]
MTITTPAPLRVTRPERRLSLRTKALLISVLPILGLGVLLAALLTAQRRAEVGTISRSLSASVASVLASTLDVTDLTQVNVQLRAAVASPSVAFIDVQPAGEAPRYFFSDEPQTDWLLRAQLDAFLQAQPGGTHLEVPDTRAQAYRAAQAALEDTWGVGAPQSVTEHLRDAVARLSATEGQTQVYEVTQLDVYDTPGGRVLRLPGEAAPAGQPLFHLAIGVTLGSLNTALHRQLLLVLLACAVTAMIAALVAYWAVRRVVGVILAITEAAQQASLGQLDGPIQIRPGGRPDELGDLISAIERLRVSLHLALSRLRPGGRP